MAQLAFQRARTEEKKCQRAAALVEAARSLTVENGVASVALIGVANRAGIHYSAVRRYFSSHKEVLLHLVAEGWVRWCGRRRVLCLPVCAFARKPWVRAFLFFFGFFGFGFFFGFFGFGFGCYGSAGFVHGFRS